MARFSLLEASQHARLEEEVEELEAETMAASACFRAAAVDGVRDGGGRHTAGRSAGRF